MKTKPTPKPRLSKLVIKRLDDSGDELWTLDNNPTPFIRPSGQLVQLPNKPESVEIQLMDGSVMKGDDEETVEQLLMNRVGGYAVEINER